MSGAEPGTGNGMPGGMPGGMPAGAPGATPGGAGAPPVPLTDFDITAPLPTGTVLLEASAGTGKTWTIAALVTRYVAEGIAPLQQMLAQQTDLRGLARAVPALERDEQARRRGPGRRGPQHRLRQGLLAHRAPSPPPRPSPG